MSKQKRGDIVDRLVNWGCKILHLQKYSRFLRQLAKFIIVGVINTAINWTIYFALCYFWGVAPLISSAIAFALSTIFNFWASTTWVFDTTTKKSRRRLFIEFAVFTGIAFLLFDEGMLWLLIYPLGMNYMLAKVITTIFGMVFNFITRKLFLEDKNQLKQKLKAKIRQRRKKR